MGKYRKFFFFLTVAFAGMTLGGIVVVILTPRQSMLEAFFDAIILIIAGASILIALYSQVTAEKESKRLEGMIHDVNAIHSGIIKDMKVEKEEEQRLQEIEQLNEKIFRKLNSIKISPKSQPISQPYIHKTTSSKTQSKTEIQSKTEKTANAEKAARTSSSESHKTSSGKK